MRGSLAEGTFAPFRKAGNTYSFPEDARVFFMKAASGDTVSGYAVLGRVNRLAVHNNTVLAVASDKAYLYWQQPPICYRREGVSVEVVGSYIDGRSLKQAGTFKIEHGRLKQLYVGPTGIVFELPVPEDSHYFDGMSIRVLVTSEISDHSQL